MKLLSRGMRGYEVEYLQRLLNKALVHDKAAGAKLDEDGIFGPLTQAALQAYQQRHRPLKVDGIAGRHSWEALGVDTQMEHSSVRLFGQPSTTTCWSAAATMIVGNQSVGPGSATLTNGGLDDSIDNVEAFANSRGWKVLNHSPSVQELVNTVWRTPVWINGGGTGWSHAVVLSGVFSDGDSSGDGTMFRLHDPWPVNVGKIYGSFANPISMYDAGGHSRVPANLEHVIIP